MERRDVDIRAARLLDPERPFGAKSGNERCRVDPVEDDVAVGKFREESVDCRSILGAADMQRPERCEVSARLEEGAGGGGQRLDRRPAISLRPERRRATGRVIAGCSLGFEYEYLGLRADRRGEAGARHAGADDGDVVDPRHGGDFRHAAGR